MKLSSCRNPKHQGRLGSVRHYMGARFHRWLFFTFAIAILITLGTEVLILHLTVEEDKKEQSIESIRSFFVDQFTEVWDNDQARNAFADSAATAFHVGLISRDASGRVLGEHGGCSGPKWSLSIDKDGSHLGSVDVCPATHFGPERSRLLLGLCAASIVLWIFAGIIAHKLGKPLLHLAHVTREIGEGKLSSRARLLHAHEGELGMLTHSINEMAERIERQLQGQRELLAGVSHEIRTPLARLRVLTEILRERGVDDRPLADFEREIAEIDDLTGQLLASSRLEFESIDRVELDPLTLSEGSLARANLQKDLLLVQGQPRPINGDPTLLGRALLNLLENARRHGEGLTRLVLSFEPDVVRFLALDSGPGLSSDDLRHAFDSFYRGKGSGSSASSLGLGLSLVSRIARAHGGDAHARNHPNGGAEVGFSVRAEQNPS